MFYLLEETTSTNDEARSDRYRHGDLIRAERQTAGRGQRGHTWTSRTGENLLFSLVLEPTFLPVGRQFLLSQAVSLGLVDTMADYGIDARIKWTNDIYAGLGKAVGILIEHNLTGATLSRTIVGIGVNVNQTEFDPSLPNPTSMRIETGRTFDRDEVLGRLYDNLMARYEALARGDEEALQRAYRSRMFRLNERQLFRFADGRLAEAVICGVLPAGELLLDEGDGCERGYRFGEVEFILHP